MQENEIRFIFEKISHLRIGVIGDFAVDFYYLLNKKTAEFSLETHQEVWWGRQPRTSLGAAGNVVQNLAAMNVPTLKVFGAVGQDMYAREMLHLLHQLNVDTAGLRPQSQDWETCTYTKPFVNEAEQNRIDFGTHNSLSNDAFDGVLKSLKSQLSKLDVLIINQQFAAPLLTADRVEMLNALIAVHPQVFVLADMRTYGRALRGATLKVNTKELARLLELKSPDLYTAEECAQYGRQLSDLIEGPVLITRGEHGMQYIREGTVYQSAALPLTAELDTVGAGDTAVAAFAACMGAQIPVIEALALANLAAAVTVQKLHQTGTATEEEVVNLAKMRQANMLNEV
ncbi:bifunctional heptose 7-phosphate kinase/heptose 1-phosphate adenyltransferase [Arundinibacter roseus]|uniref:Carbohydrate kinase n=1 Tax=Arundinibacter roseus TaxID=2070510 RepID=A0A4R4K3A5_9BACT|nr:PfkB family carbohydrate kinase [Arundinibacter roseus]TDB61867.1 carbohydrate kinase [Arundinibacter roseus]